MIPKEVMTALISVTVRQDKLIEKALMDVQAGEKVDVEAVKEISDARKVIMDFLIDNGGMF